MLDFKFIAAPYQKTNPNRKYYLTPKNSLKAPFSSQNHLKNDNSSQKSLANQTALV